MERPEISIGFAELRQLATSVPAYLTERAGETTVPPLRAELEDELGLAGLDTEEMIMGFAEIYRVDYTKFDFTGLISPEHGSDLWDSIWFFPLAAYLLAAWLLKAVASLLCWPFDSHLAKRIWQWQLPTFQPVAYAAQPNPLTIGDFVASAAVGRFVRREQVRFRLVR